MGKLLAIDYGGKRCGIAVTDDMQIIASGLDTIATTDLLEWLVSYTQKETVERFIIGLPKRMHGQASAIEPEIQKFITKLGQKLSHIPIERYDERFTSKLALDTLLKGGASKKKRQEKGIIDKISATLILQGYMDNQSNNPF